MGAGGGEKMMWLACGRGGGRRGRGQLSAISRNGRAISGPAVSCLWPQKKGKRRQPRS